MKYLKWFLQITACAAAMLSCNHQNGPSFTVSGDIDSLSGRIYLSVYEGKMPHHIDSADVLDGTFSFSGTAGMPQLASIDTPEGTLVRFFIEDSPITISGNAAKPGEIAVRGSETDRIYKSYRAGIDSLMRMMYADSLPAAKADSIYALTEKMKRDFVRDNNDNMAGAYVFYREVAYSMDHNQLDSVLATFDTTLLHSSYLSQVADMSKALKNTAVGQTFIDFTLPDTEGRQLSLSSVAGLGNYVLLDFWASWCPPCRAESPNMVEAYRKYHDRGFDIFAVSMDRNRESWLRGIKSMNLDWNHVSALRFWDCPPAEIYGVRAIPANVLIDPEGRIIARNLMGDELLDKLAELLPGKSPSASTEKRGNTGPAAALQRR